MNTEELGNLVSSTVAEINRLLVVKGGEYAGSDDRLGNFKRGSARVGVHSLQILWIYAAKHIDSIETYIRDTAGGIDRPRSEPIAGRLDDLINYCILAKALIQEIENAKPHILVDDQPFATGDEGAR
jgi:hypothetical protein